MDLLSSYSTAKKLASLGGNILSRSQKEGLLKTFQVETNEHSLLTLEMLVGALRQHDQERGKPSRWYDATVDESLPAAVRHEALAELRETFLRLLRIAHGPIPGNDMLVVAVAGLTHLDYPENMKARVLAIVPQLTPPDIDLLVRYVTQGIGCWRITPEGDEEVFTRIIVQENYVLRFMLSGTELSEPLDSLAYNALKHHNLVTDHSMREPGPARKPTELPGGPPPVVHAPFRLQWRFGVQGKMLVEAFTGYSLRKILESEVGPPMTS